MVLFSDDSEWPVATGGGPQSVGGLTSAARKCLDDLVRGGDLGSETSPFPEALQAASVQRIRVGAERMCRELPTGNDRDVFADVVGGLDYQGESTTAVGLEESLLSLPLQGAVPKPLSGLLGPTGEVEVHQIVNEMLLPIEEARENLAAASTPPAYIDPGLRRSKKRYVKFVLDLVERVILSPSFKNQADVGVFAVKKKNGKQRLVVDARRSNVCFRTPSSVALPTSAAFSRLHVPEGRHLHCFSFDLKDAFYQIELPVVLRPFFCLPGLLGETSALRQWTAFRAPTPSCSHSSG